MNLNPDVIGRTIDYLCQEMTKLEERMEQQIDPRTFGKLEGDVQALQKDVAKIVSSFGKLDEKVDKLTNVITEARGGWRATMLLAGVASAVGGAITWAFQHVTLK